MNLSIFISSAVREGASDLHFKTDSRPFLRDRGGELAVMSDIPCSQEDIADLLSNFLASKAQTEAVRQLLEGHRGELDGGASIEGIRLRFNAFCDQAGLSLAIRLLRDDILDVKTLGLPSPLSQIMSRREGLILFCGATGMGKTTAMYALLDEVNSSMRKHIITLDDPTEIILKPQKSIISQREIGTDSNSFADALRAAVREDPDIILVGEMRDKETVMAAFAAAETGHLVLSTIHCSSVVDILDRILPFYPANAYAQVQEQLASTFAAMVGCRLMKGRDGGRVGAYELLLNIVPVAAAIRDGNSMHLKDYMTPAHGMQSMEMAINGLKYMHLLAED